MRNLALTISIVGLFAMAAVGWLSDLPPFVCAYRALIGAAVLFAVTSLAGRWAIALMVSAVMRPKDAKRPDGRQSP